MFLFLFFFFQKNVFSSFFVYLLGSEQLVRMLRWHLHG